MSDDLSQKQALFCLEYLVDLNATQAAIRAGYPKRSAGSMGYKLLSNEKVQDSLKKLFAERRQRLEVTADNTIKELARMAFSDLKDFAKWGQKRVLIGAAKDKDGKRKRRKSIMVNFVDFINSDQVDGAQVQQVKIDKHGQASIKLYDKTKSLETLARHFGLTGPDSGDGALSKFMDTVKDAYEMGKHYKKPE